MSQEMRLILLLAISLVLMRQSHAEQDDGQPLCQANGTQNLGHQSSVHLASWRWDHVGIYIVITIFIVLSGLAKVAFHHAHFISSRVPESCLLVIVGLIMGGIIILIDKEEVESGCKDPLKESHVKFPEFTPDLFFFALLPPIILESAYSLYDKAFFDNLSTILIMAVIGTAFNFISIGLLLYMVHSIGAMGKIRQPFHDSPHEGFPDISNDLIKTGICYNLSITEILLFSSLISAVDPVAVLAIFQEVGVNPDLYFLLFGESLLNDGVAVVLYTMMNTFAAMSSTGQEINAVDITLGITSFLTVVLGGMSIGLVVGLITALITRTTSEVRVVEPLAIFGMAYMAYVVAEVFHFSGIISLICCGIVQAHYAFKNISKKSYTTVKYFIKMLSSTSDCIIFLFLGIAVVKGPHYWHTGFVVWTVSFCLICRFIGVYVLTWIVNRKRVRQVNLQEQFITAYGGLRGAVGFSLVEMINEATVPPKHMFVTTTLAVVMFTIFFQGGTIKWLVNLLDIDKKKEEQPLISECVNETLMDHIMAGIEIVSGRRGFQYFNRSLERFDEKYLMKWFTNGDGLDHLAQMYEELSIADHLCNLYGPTLMTEEGKSSYLKKDVDNDEDLPDLDPDGSPPPIPPRITVAKPSLTRHRPSSAFDFKRMGRQETNVSNQDNEVFEIEENPGSSFRSTRSQESDITMVRNAFLQAPYAKLHHKFNKNLINDENQEIEAHLRRRRTNARRISQIIMDSSSAPWLAGSFFSQPTSPSAGPSGDDLADTDQRSFHTRRMAFKDQPRGMSLNEDRMEEEGESPDRTTENLMFRKHSVSAKKLISQVPARQRPGVEAVLNRQSRRIRSMSVQPTREVQLSFRNRKVTGALGSIPGETVEAVKMSDTANTEKSPVVQSGKRKLTPFPLSPPAKDDQAALHHLSVLEEDEECLQSKEEQQGSSSAQTPKTSSDNEVEIASPENDPVNGSRV